MNLARLAVVLAVISGTLTPIGFARQKWLRASTDDVTVISDASPRAVTEYAVKYSAFRRAFIQLLAPAGHAPPPVMLVLFRRGSELSDHLAKPRDTSDNMIAFSTEVDNAALVALAEDGDREEALSLAFEFETVWSLGRVGYSLPLWMTQGTGEVFASLRVKKGECRIDGGLNRADSAWRRETALPWNRFFAVHSESPEYKGKKATGIYQAQAWALMNFVLLQEGNIREQFEVLAKKLRARRGDQEAVEETLGIPVGNLRAAIDRHLRGKHSVAIPFDETAILARLKIGSADEAEVKVRLSDLLAANGREAEAAVLIGEAAALAPGAIYVNEALARRELRQNELSAAARYYRVAMAAGSTNPNAWITSATEHLDRNKALGSDFAGAGGKSAEVAMEEIRRALQLDPGDLRAWRLLGRAYFVSEKASEEGIGELSRALTEEVDGLHVRYYRGLLYSRLGRKQEAMSDLEVVIAHPKTPQVLQVVAAAFKMQLQFDEDNAAVEKLVRGARYDEARGLIDRGIEQAAGTSSARDYRRIRELVNENESWAKTVNLYNQRNWADAIVAGRKFLEAFPRSPMRGEAQRLVSSAGEFAKYPVPGDAE